MPISRPAPSIPNPYARQVVQLSRAFECGDPDAMAAYIALQRPLIEASRAAAASTATTTAKPIGQ